MMNHENTVRRHDSSAGIRRGIHLVHSRAWTPETRQNVRMLQEFAAQRKPVERVSAVDALKTPVVRAGQAVLRWMHVR